MRLFVVLAKRCSCRDIPRKPLLYELFFCLRGWRNVWKMFFLMAKIALGWYDDTPFRVIFSWFLTHIGGAIFPKIISSLQAKKYIFLAEALRVTFKGIPLGEMYGTSCTLHLLLLFSRYVLPTIWLEKAQSHLLLQRL